MATRCSIFGGTIGGSMGGDGGLSYNHSGVIRCSLFCKFWLFEHVNRHHLSLSPLRLPAKAGAQDRLVGRGMRRFANLFASRSWVWGIISSPRLCVSARTFFLPSLRATVRWRGSPVYGTASGLLRVSRNDESGRQSVLCVSYDCVSLTPHLCNPQAAVVSPARCINQSRNAFPFPSSLRGA